jgi:hypothetical protein
MKSESSLIMRGTPARGQCLSTVLPPLLALPFELRAQIYSYLVPYTITPDADNPAYFVWVRRTATLLWVCQQTYHEFRAMMYGSNTWTFGATFHSLYISRPEMGKESRKAG